MDMHIAQDVPLTGINVYSLPPPEGEAVLRRQLAAAYRLVDHFGWTELIYGHLTARVPGDKPHFLINPFGLNYDEVTASNLVKIDMDGNVVDPTPMRSISPASSSIRRSISPMPRATRW